MKEFTRFSLAMFALILLLPYMIFLVVLIVAGELGERLRNPFARRILFPLTKWAART